jgi:hypothetical protein
MNHSLLALAFGATLFGCVTSQGVAKQRASHDFSCPEDQVQVTRIAGSSYDASGCGKKAVYNCAAGNTVVCVPEHSSSEQR